MASTTIGSSGVTFPDATTQATAATNTSANVNSVSAGTGISVNSTTGAVTVTNSGVTSVTAGTGISVSASTGGVTITNTSSASGTVTSVATGNGLSGGTITSTGTLIIACPSFNSVGSYVSGVVYLVYSASISSGSNYSAGGGDTNAQSGGLIVDTNNTGGNRRTNNLSGTWKWMGSNTSNNGEPFYLQGLWCRVS